MNKNKFYIGAIVALIASNLLLMCVAFSPNDSGPHHDRPRNSIIEKLDLDDEQIKQYDLLISKHRMDIHALDDKIMQLKYDLYGTLIVVDDQNKKLLLSKLNEAQNEVENIHYDHFLDIKEICRDNQQDKYGSLAKEIAQIFSHKRPHKK